MVETSFSAALNNLLSTYRAWRSRKIQKNFEIDNCFTGLRTFLKPRNIFKNVALRRF